MMLRALTPFYRFPKLTLLGFFLGTLFFSWAAMSHLFDDQGHLILDTSFTPLFDNKSPTFSYHQEMEQEFGSEELLILAVEPKGHYFNLKFLLELETISAKITKTFPALVSLTSILDIPQISGDCVGKSYFHSLHLSSSCVSLLDKYRAVLECKKLGALIIPEEPMDLGLGLESSASEVEEPTTAFVCNEELLSQSLDQIKLDTEKVIHHAITKLKANPLIQKDLFSFDQKATVFIVRLKHKDTHERDQDLRNFEALIQDHQKSSLNLFYAGQPREQFEITKLLIQDIKSILPFSFLLLSFVVFFLFRSFFASLLLFITLSAGMIWTAGIFGLSGARLNLITLVLPPVVTTVGTSYAINYLAQYFQAARKLELGHQEVLERALLRVSLPAVLALLTTLVGFSALIWSPIPAIAELGFFACVGIFLMASFSLILIPCALTLLPLPARENKPERAGILDEGLTWLGAFVNSKSNPIAIVWAVVVLVSIFGATQVRVDSKVSNFPAQSKLTKDKNYLEKHFGGSSFVRIIFQTKEKAKDLETAATVKGLVLLQDWLLSGDAKTTGIEINRLYSPIDQISLQLQGMDNINDEEVRFYLGRMEKNYGALFLNPKRNLLNVTIRLKNHSSRGFLEFTTKLEHKLQELFPHLTFRLSGNAILSMQSAQNIAESQIISLAIAVSVIFLILSVLFFSLKAGFLALIPNLVSILIFFGLLGFNDIPISATLSVIAAIALGIGIDDSIHFITHFNQNLKELQVEKKATSKTLRSVGKPMIFTTIALAIGFGVLMTSKVTGQSSFGWLTATTLLVSLSASLFLLPAILTQTKFIVLWDYLTLRYTPEFISSIPLFYGMNLVESKLVTLVAETKDYKPEENIFLEHELGKDLFVVLEGEVEIYFDERFHGVNKKVAHFTRGQVFGEMALFPQARRMDSAKTITKAKLLMLNNQNLMQLKEKFPQTAIKLYLSLVKNLCDSLFKDIQIAELGHRDHTFDQAPPEVIAFANALNKIQSGREEGLILGNFNLLRGYYQRFFSNGPRVDLAGALANEEGLNQLIQLTLSTRTIKYHQLVLIKGYIQMNQSFSAKTAMLTDHFIHMVERGEIIETKPDFSNILFNLTPKELKILCQSFEINEITKGGRLYQQGDYGEKMYIVMEGKLELTRELEQQKQILSHLVRGDAVGEISLFTPNHFHTTNLTCLEDAKYLVISRESFELFLQNHKKVAATFTFNLIGVFITHLRRSILNLYG
ncbi:MAG: MMPL family transporter [SAR324 cluster bacterium]|nr:MMPL family transporter [SAR324 cluster bacterium]